MRAATKVVLELMEQYPDKGVTLYTDNWYTSWELAQTQLVETLQKNRKGLPKEVVNAKLKKVQIVGQEKNKLIDFKWKYRRDVFHKTHRRNGRNSW
ncbi:hypothetical protein JTB14_021149 [Gonioctena quinquepunctata]|nr:hypothetical protein JTB14_021149 [Gonioctena quinquepunctata]